MEVCTGGNGMSIKDYLVKENIKIKKRVVVSHN